MGKYGFGPGLGGANPSYDSGPVQPTYGGGGGSTSSAGFQARGFPEAIQANQFIPEQVASNPTEFIDKVLVRGPAYVYERPIAAASQLLGMPEGESVLDPVSSFFEDLPIVGEHLSNAGKMAEKSFALSGNLVGSFLNSPKAQIFQEIAQMPEGTTDLPVHLAVQLELLGMEKNAQGRITVQDVRRFAQSVGFTGTDWQDLAANRKGWFDFGDKTTAMGGDLKGSSDWRAIADMGNRMVLDPLNVALLGGPAIAAKAGVSAAKLAGLVRSSTVATKGLTSAPALAAKASAAAIDAGKGSAATLEGLGMFGKSFTKNGAKLYRRSALGTTGTQLSVNAVDAMVPEDADIPDALRGVFEMFSAMGERKPLSNNDLFALGSLLSFPARSMASAGMKNVRKPINAARRYSHEQTILKALYPDMEYVAARAAAVTRLGSESSFNAAMMQLMRAALFQKNFLEGIATIPTRYAHASLSELGFNVGKLNQAMNRAIKRSLAEGGLTNKDVARALDRFVAGRGDTTAALTAGVEKAWLDPEDFYRAWEQWEPFAARLSEIFPDGSPIVPGLMYDVAIQEGVDWVKVMVNDAAKDGMISGQDLAEILRTQPALHQLKGAQDLAAVLTRDGRARSYDVKALQETLNELRDQAIPAVDYFAPQAAREGFALSAEARVRSANQLFRTTGELADDINPALSKADIIVQTAGGRRAKAAGVTGGFTATVRGLRDHVKTAALEQEIPRGLEMSDFKVHSVVQVGLLRRTSTKSSVLNADSGLAMRMNEAKPMSDLMDAAALSLETTGGDFATIVLRGENLIKSKGLEANGIEYTWNVGRVGDRAFDDLAASLERFGDRVVINDTTGLVRVIVPDGKDVQKALDEASKRMGAPTRDAVHFRDIINRKKVTTRDPAGSILLRDVIANTRRSRRYHATRGYIDHGVDSVGRGQRVSVASRSPNAERARASRRDHYSDRPASGSQPTRWERQSGRGVRGRTGEHRVVLGDDVSRAEWTDKLNAAGVRDINPVQPFRFRAGDELFATADGSSGAVVRADGELVLWLKSDVAGRRLPATDDFGSVVSEASEHATWTRVVDRRDSRGVSPVDHLADHGWAPVAKSAPGTTDELVVWLVRDPDGVLGFKVPSPRNGRYGGWQSMMDDPTVMELSPRQARIQTTAQAESLYAERGARARQAAIDEDLVMKQAKIDDLDTRLAAERARLETPKYKSEIKPTRAAEFRANALKNKAMRGDEGSAGLTILDEAELASPGTRMLMSKDGTAGVVIKADGELAMVYRQPGSATKIDDLILEASQEARYLSAYGAVVPVYERNGWRVVAKTEFDPAFADVGATAARQGDVYFMVNERLAKQAIPDKAPTVAYDDAQAIIDAIVPPGTTGFRKASLGQSSTYRALTAERDRLFSETSTRAAKARADTIFEKEINPGNFTFVKGLEDDLEKYHPRMDESVGGNLDTLPPAEAAKLAQLEADLRRNGGFYDRNGEWVNGSDYTLKVVPRHGTPYYATQGDAYTAMMQGKMAMADTIRDKVTSRASQVHSALFDRVYSREMASQTRQEIYNELVNAGASPREVNRFLAALRNEWESQSFQFMGAKPRKTMDALSPNLINAVARGNARTKDGKVIFLGFEPEVIAKVGNFGDMMQRTGSRTFRNLAKKYPATPGSGNLGKLIEQWYGKQSGGNLAAVGRGTRQTVFKAAFGYHVLRFMLDPRWYAMNLFEGEILGMARYGHKVRQGARSKTIGQEIRNRPGTPVVQDPAIERLAGKSGDTALLAPEEILHADASASGWLDPRNLYGFVRNASRLQRPQQTRKILQEAIDAGSPVIDDLRKTWGDNPETWIDEIEKQLYDIDTKGVRATVMSDATAVQMANTVGPQSHLYDEFLEGIFKAHTKNYQDIVHTFHGNVNRSNLERLLNSPFLWWPLSYQLKTGKWLIDVMTKQFAGHYGNEMLATAVLGTLLADHHGGWRTTPSTPSYSTITQLCSGRWG